MAPKGRRFEGDLNEVANAMAEFATAPDWLQYAEAADAKVSHGRILAARFMWRQVRALHHSLTWSPTDAEKIFELIAKRQVEQQIWPRALTPPEMADYRKKMGARFRLQARHIRQAEGKHGGRVPAWIRQLWGAATEVAKPEDAQEDATEVAKPEDTHEEAEEELPKEQDEEVEVDFDQDLLETTLSLSVLTVIICHYMSV